MRPAQRLFILLAITTLLASCGSPPVKPVPPSAPPTPTRQNFANTAQCLSALFSTGASFRKIEDFRHDNGCGMDRAVSLAAAAPNTPVSPAADIGCDMAVAFSRLANEVIQPEALRLLGQPVARINQVAGYSCRNRAPGKLSEHAKGRAIDISGFVMADGSLVDVEDDWRGSGAKSEFLRTVGRRACDYVSIVLGPSHDRAHRNHFHFDLGQWELCDP